MAPEVLSSQVFPKSDVWSAGVLCYQLLTGEWGQENPPLSPQSYLRVHEPNGNQTTATVQLQCECLTEACVVRAGYLPFNDSKSAKNPALSKIWKAILTEEPRFKGSAWAEISDQAKDFVRSLLQR